MMTPDRHRQIGQIFDDALKLAPNERTAFLDKACAGDHSLRTEVQSLLAAHEGIGDFIESPAMEVVAETLAKGGNTTTTLTEGITLGSYEVLTLIGAGGMGEVYSARDAQLNRKIALKILRSPLTMEADRLRRFQQEARAVSALNHPNIVTIHEIGHDRDLHFIAYELVEGQTLRSRLQQPLKLVEALDVAIQVASALIAAHAAGVIHRDLKPENIMVRPDGYVKVLDFGLAKLKEPTPAADTYYTQTGVVMGTFGYMSPEQARGLKVDARSDIFSFGVVLYEMVTGRRPFNGPTMSDVIAAILVSEPAPLAQYAPETPAELQRIVSKALAKNAGERYQSVKDLWLDLKELKQTVELGGRLTRDSGEMRAVQPRSMKWWKAAAALILVAGAIGGAWSLWRSPTPAGPVRLAYTQLTNFADSATSPSLSPDGRMVTFIRGDGSFISAGQIYVKILPNGEPKQLTQDGDFKMSPVFSPDGTRIAYTIIDDQNEWDTWEVPVLGGAPRRLLPNASGLVWVDKQNFLFSEKIRGSKGNHMKVVTAQESRVGQRDLYIPMPKGAMAHRSYPSPDGKWVLIVEMDDRGEFLPCRAVPIDGSSTGRKVGPLDAACLFGAWSLDGQWIYLNSASGGSLHIWREQFSDREPLAAPEQITSGPTEEEGISMAPDGRSFVTAVGLKQSSVWLRTSKGEGPSSSLSHAEHGKLDADDRQISLEGQAAFPLFTPDGKKLLYLAKKGALLERSELWMADLETGRNEPLLPGFLLSYSAVRPYDVSPDGQNVVLQALDTENKNRLWLAPIDRQSPPTQIPNAEGDGPVFGPDGQIFFRGREGDYGFAYRVRTDGTGLQKAFEYPVIQITGLSADGQWLVVYARPDDQRAGGTLALPLAGGSPIQIFGNSTWLEWSRDGRQLLVSISRSAYSGQAGTTYVIPLPRGRMWPAIPAGGFPSENALAALPGARVIDSGDVAPGPAPDVFALTRSTVHRNLYSIPVP